MLSYMASTKITADVQDLNIVRADVAWAAAAYAQRVNGAYLKPERNGYKTVSEDDDRVANKFLMKEAMFENPPVLTEDDYAVGEAARDYHSKKLMMTTFSRELSDFERTLTRAVGMDVFTESDRYELAIIASQIQSYNNSVQEDQAVAGIGEKRGYVAGVGERVEFECLILSRRYNYNYNTYSVRGITLDGYRVQFFLRDDNIAKGQTVGFKGTVKKHLDNITIFNRVKKGN
jgi:hypothetical protein